MVSNKVFNAAHGDGAASAVPSLSSEIFLHFEGSPDYRFAQTQAK
jgi:hypothetical protein